MSYRIEYDGRAGKYELRKNVDIFPWILAACGIILLLICCFWTDGASAVKEFIIPGEDTITVRAFSAMTDDLRSGASVWDAVECFCRTVIHEK